MRSFIFLSFLSNDYTYIYQFFFIFFVFFTSFFSLFRNVINISVSLRNSYFVTDQAFAEHIFYSKADIWRSILDLGVEKTPSGSPLPVTPQKPISTWHWSNKRLQVAFLGVSSLTLMSSVYFGYSLHISARVQAEAAIKQADSALKQADSAIKQADIAEYQAGLISKEQYLAQRKDKK